MNKILLLFIIVLIAFSCNDTTNEISVANLNHTNNPSTIDVKVKSNDWILNTDSVGVNKYYTYHSSMPSITSSVFDTATINSYILTGSSGTLQTLPYVGHLQNAAGTAWTQTIDFDYTVGGINVYITNSALNADPPGTMDFNVVIK